MQERRNMEALVGVMFLALLLRLPLLNGSFWLDEAAQALEIVRPLSQQLHIVEDFQPPLLHLILHMAQYMSHAEWYLRTIGALIPGLITIYAVYQIGKHWMNHYVGLTAALLLATSSFHIFYSQELRPYALPAMIAALSWLSILRWDGQRTRVFDPTVCALTFFGLFSSYLYPFLIGSQMLYVTLKRREHRRRLSASLALAGIGFLPWLPFFFGQFKQGAAVQTSLPGWAAIVGIPQLKSLPLVAGKFIFGVLDLQLSPLFVTAAILLIGSTALLVRKLSCQDWHRLSLPLIWLVVPVATAWLISFAVPILQPKRVLFSLPAFYLLIAYLVEQGRQKAGNGVAKVLLATVLSINIASVAGYALRPELQRENWRALHQQIVTQYPKELSVVVFAFPEAFAPWRWYDDGSYPTIATGQLRITKPEEAQTTLRPVVDGQYRYVLVFDYLRDLTDPDTLIPQTLTSMGYQERDILEYPTIGFVRVFARTQDVTAYAHWH